MVAHITTWPTTAGTEFFLTWGDKKAAIGFTDRCGPTELARGLRYLADTVDALQAGQPRPALPSIATYAPQSEPAPAPAPKPKRERKPKAPVNLAPLVVAPVEPAPKAVLVEPKPKRAKKK